MWVRLEDKRGWRVGVEVEECCWRICGKDRGVEVGVYIF